MTTELTKPQEQPQSILQIIADVAKDPKVNIDVMQKLVDLQFRIMDEERTQVLNAAMAKFEPMLNTLVKSKAGAKTKDGKVKFYYTPYEDIDRMIRKPLRDCGLRLSFTTRIVADKPYFVTQVQEVTKGGVAEAMLPYVPDTNEQLNGPQKISSGLSFAERRGVALLFNLVFEGEDDNGQFAGAISTDDVGRIERLMTECKIDRAAFSDYLERECGVREIPLIPAQALKEIESKLEQRKKAGPKANGGQA